MSVREKDNPQLYARIQEQNLLRQYDLLSNCIEIGLAKGIELGVATLRRHVDKSGNKLEPPLRGPSRLWRENAKSSEHADHDLQAGYFDIPGSCAPPKPLLGQQAIHSTVAYPSS